MRKSNLHVYQVLRAFANLKEKIWPPPLLHATLNCPEIIPFFYPSPSLRLQRKGRKIARGNMVRLIESR